MWRRPQPSVVRLFWLVSTLWELRTASQESRSTGTSIIFFGCSTQFAVAELVKAARLGVSLSEGDHYLITWHRPVSITAVCPRLSTCLMPVTVPSQLPVTPIRRKLEHLNLIHDMGKKNEWIKKDSVAYIYFTRINKHIFSFSRKILVQVWQKFQGDSWIYLQVIFVFVCFVFPYHHVITEQKERPYTLPEWWLRWWVTLALVSDWAWCYWCDVIDIPPPPLSSSGPASAIIQLDCLLIITRNNANQGGKTGLQHGLWLVNRSQPRPFIGQDRDTWRHCNK